MFSSYRLRGIVVLYYNYFCPRIRVKIAEIRSNLEDWSYEGGYITSLWYVEANLKIPEIKTFNENILLLVIVDSSYAQHVSIQIGILHIDQTLELITGKK